MTSGASASATKAAPVALASVASMLARPEVRFFRENLRRLLSADVRRKIRERRFCDVLKRSKPPVNTK
jgi:predicted alpha/beta-fold hydrolase